MFVRISFRMLELYASEIFRLVKVRFVGGNVIPGEKMRLWQVVTAFVKVCPAGYSFQGGKIVKTEYVEGNHERELPSDALILERCCFEEHMPPDLPDNVTVDHDPSVFTRAESSLTRTHAIEFQVVVSAFATEGDEEFDTAILMNRVIGFLIHCANVFLGNEIFEKQVMRRVSDGE